MVRTDQAYINEYLVYDEVFEACEACERACVEADYFMMKQARRDYLDAYFSEAMNFGKKKEPEMTENNFFAKIGKAIVNLINKIKDIIKKITDALVSDRKKTEKANSAIQKIISDNPELKKQIINGVKKNWFTIYDVAAYKNDVIGLINMLDQAKIDNQTALDKFKEMTEKATKGTMSAVASAGGLLGIAKFLNEIMKSRKAISDNLSTMQKMAEVIKTQDYQKGKNPDKLGTKLRILSGAVQVLVGFDKKYVDAYDALHKTIDKYNAEEAADAKTSDTTNDHFKGANDRAKKKINEYNSKVDDLVEFAAKNRCKNGEPEFLMYGNKKSSLWSLYDDISKTYGRYCSNLSDGKFKGFLSMVDSKLANADKYKITNIQDVIDMCKDNGKFIKYNAD